MVMRKLQLDLPLNQTQKIRFERAMERLRSLSSTANNSVIVTTDSIPVNHEDAFLEGHGTSEVDGELLATVCGVTVRVDQLVYVRTLRTRYNPEVGDIVVGRAIEVTQSRWRVELNSTQDGVLKLSSMVKPDDVQVEVGCIHRDGGLGLQALKHKCHKYGKLDKGMILKVDPYLVKRSNHHIHYIESHGIDLILGRNGYIWIGEHVQV